MNVTMTRFGWNPNDVVLEPADDENLVASAQTFANPWHDEIGRFAPKGTGRKVESGAVTEDFAEPPAGYRPEYAETWRAGYEYLRTHEMPEWWAGTEIMDEDGLPKRENQVGQDWDHKGINDEIAVWKEEVGEAVADGVWSIGREADRAREHAIRVAISTNQIDLEAALERWGEYDIKPEGNWGEWQDLPPVLYHATSALSAIEASGRLMSRGEIGGRSNAAGLGGGGEDTISFTSDREIADGIVRSLHEVHRAVTTDNDSLRHELEQRAGSWWPDVVESARSIHGIQNGQPHSVEDRYNLYRTYSTYRQQHEGVLDPLFFNVDPDRLARINPNDIGVVTVEPAMTGARGYQVSALGEWRTPTGAATSITNIDRVDDHQTFRIQFANPWHDEIGRFAPKGTGTKGRGAIGDEEADAAFEEEYGNERPSGDGDCFPTALHYMMYEVPNEERDRYRLVHGVPTGQGDIEGVRFDHAWVERTDPLPDAVPAEQREMWERHGMNIVVIDKSNGNDVEMPRVLYYQFGNIEEKDVVRYTFEEAARHAVRAEHYGPWT